MKFFNAIIAISQRYLEFFQLNYSNFSVNINIVVKVHATIRDRKDSGKTWYKIIKLLVPFWYPVATFSPKHNLLLSMLNQINIYNVKLVLLKVNKNSKQRDDFIYSILFGLNQSPCNLRIQKHINIPPEP